MSSRQARGVVDRALAGRGSLEDCARVAEALNAPLWALLLPGLHQHRELLTAGGLEGLVGVVENYLASTPARRAQIEIVARAGASVSRTQARVTK